MSLLVLLFAPLLVGGHAHVADHDGGEHHVDAPHGAHTVSLSDTSDRLPTSQIQPGVSAPATAVESPLPEPALLQDPPASAVALAPARGPPRAIRSRAPPASPH